MKKPSFEQVSLTVLLVGGLFWFFISSRTEQERYIDYCGDSVYRRPGAVQQQGITPLLLPDEDVPKYRQQVQWIRPASDD